jgi:multiple sugar transport system permease protein
MAMYIVRTAINGSDMGYGSALTVASFVLLAAFSLLLMRTTGVKLEEGLL